MIFPEIKTLTGIDLARPRLPDDIDDCEMAIEAMIGPLGSSAAEIFAFTVITPAALTRETGFRWGRGLLIVSSFSWEAVDRAVAGLLAHCSRPTWEEVAQELNKNVNWEFENYRE